MSYDYLHSATALACLVTATDCNAVQACLGSRQPSAAQCPTTASPAYCDDAGVGVNCGANGGLASTYDCKVLGGTCGLYTTDAGTGAGCKVLTGCTETDPTHVLLLEQRPVQLLRRQGLRPELRDEPSLFTRTPPTGRAASSTRPRATTRAPTSTRAAATPSSSAPRRTATESSSPTTARRQGSAAPATSTGSATRAASRPAAPTPTSRTAPNPARARWRRSAWEAPLTRSTARK